MRVYHFIDTQWGLADLCKQHLKIARINELNDPFEFMGVDLSEPDFCKNIGDLKEYLNRRYGLLCFSKGWQNPVLWSHYADNHKGLCLGFDVSDDLLRQVNYEDQRLPARLLQDVIDKPSEPDVKDMDIMLEILSTKSSDWHYEQEYRMFPLLSDAKRIDDLYYLDFSSDIRLKEVIIGVRSYITIKVVEAAVEDTDDYVDIFKVRKDHREFAMVKDNGTFQA